MALIAAVRRFLVVTAGTAPITQRDSLVELALLLAFMVASAYALYLVRPGASPPGLSRGARGFRRSVPG